MSARMRSLATGALITVLLGGALAASALWSAGADADTPSVAIGAVRFGAASETVPERVFSPDGGAVSVTLPGSTVLEVLEQTSIDADPVIWRFTASGSALGITGLDYTVAVTEQVGADGSYDLSAGIAQPGTVLERSTLIVYRAGAGGDCSAIPEVPAPEPGETPRNVHVVDAVDVELQAAGAALTGTETSQEWCAAIDWNDVADGAYVNDVHVTGIAEDGSGNGATARWHAQVGYPPALEQLGVYRNRATVEATAEDTTSARATSEWHADVYPDPSGEPGIVITLDPVVTNLNPDVAPRD